jgi:hypothetical protein
MLPHFIRGDFIVRILSILGATTLGVGSLVSVAQAAPIANEAGLIQTATNTNFVEKTQYAFGGQNYCWYGGGWQGPGWYWCGYAWRRGFGWGGGDGWHGWHWHGGHGGWHGGHGGHGPVVRHGGRGHRR